MIEIIESYGYLDGIIFIAFDYDNLVKVKNLRPKQTVQFLTKDVSDELIEKLAEAGMDADIHHPSLTKERIDAFHAKGVKLNCWTVDDPARAEELAAWGVDYITSNILE
ncbi:MAG: glycerophosphodiester phosphodiesterase [Clostridia bacterium]|nr:glycerophosphodiester phosphodiesterase [Clostridia bacterium]